MKVISAENVQGNFFGGLPYNAIWDFGGGNTPSKLTVSVVNENGKYGDPSSSLGYTRTQSVKIGGFNFNGYLVSYSLKGSPDQKTLELSYVDRSIDLERYYVGLKDLWGNGGKNLILVGKRYHPCDTDLDSTVEYKEKEGIPDPCDPCPEMPPNKYENACDEVLSEFEIFPVYYTFNELIDKLPVNCRFDGSEFTDFKGDFVGPLKSVLDSWCSTLGFAYFWDPFDNILEIVSRSKKLSIPSISAGNNIIDLETGATVENTFARGTVGYLGRQGEIKQYECNKSTLENLSNLTLGDLASDGEYNSGGGESGDGDGGAGGTLKDYEAKEIAVALAYYSQSMRNAFIWFYHYGIYGPEQAQERMSNGGGSGSSEGKMPASKLSFMGNMEIFQVYYRQGDEKQKAGFNRINRKLSKEQKEHLNLQTDGKGSGTADNPNYYFFIAKVNQDLFEKELATEEKLANGFLGKYWFSSFKTTIPNTTNYRTEVTVEAPDGNGQWYYKNTQLKNLPIFNFGHDEGSFVSTLDDELAESEDEIQEEINKYIDDPDKKEVQVNGFILHEREGMWEPNSDKAKWYQSLFDWYADQIPQKFAQDDGRPDILFSLYPEAKTDGAIKLFVARKGSESAFKTKLETGTGDHPAESKKRPVKTTTEQSVFGDVEVSEVAEYGLGSSYKYTKVTIGDNARPSIIIFCPVGAFASNSSGTREQDSDSDEISDDKVLYGEEFVKGSETGYDVIATASANFSIYLPKIEETYVSNPKTVDVANVTYEYFDQLENNLEPFRKGSSDFKRTNCMPDKQAMQKYMKILDKYVKYSQSEPTRRASFKMAGIFPEQYGINQGLSNVSINITDNGVFTNYVLEDKIISPPSAEVLSQRLKQNVPPRKSLDDGKVPMNKTNIKKYENAVRQVT